MVHIQDLELIISEEVDMSVIKKDTKKKRTTKVSTREDVLSKIGIVKARKNYIGTMRIHGRAKNALIASGISRLDEFLTADMADLLAIPNIGPTTIKRAVAEIQDELSDHPKHKTLSEMIIYAGCDVHHAEVLMRRFGLKTGVIETLAAIGDDLDMTRERIRQIERRASIDIKSGYRGKELRDAITYLMSDIKSMPVGDEIKSPVIGKLSQRQVTKILSILTKYQ